MCRAGCLPTMKRVSREAKLPEAHGTCKMCSSASIEDIEHLVMTCEAYSRHRSKMLESVDYGPECKTQNDRLDILLGKSMGVSKTDDRTDMAALP